MAAGTSLTLSQFIWHYMVLTQSYPSEQNAMYWVKQGITYQQLFDKLRSGHWRTEGGRTPFGTGAPDWIIRAMGPQIGVYATYLKVDELAGILIQGTAEGWDAAKLQARIQNTAYWKRTTEQQRSWNLLSPAEQAEAIARQKVRVMQTLEKYYGVTKTGELNYTLNDSRVTRWATDLAQGTQSYDIFDYAINQAARGIPGTPAYDALVEQMKQEDRTQVDISNMAFRLRDSWNNWVGTNITPPDLNIWAQNIVANQRSEADFANYIRTVSQSLFPNKPEWVSYDDWVKPARAVLSKMFETSVIPDDDPLLQSYVHGETASLADLALHARRDSRFETTTAATKEARSIGSDLLRQFGFGV